MNDDKKPEVVDGGRPEDWQEVTEENASYIAEYPDGSKVLVGPIRTIQDKAHGLCWRIDLGVVGEPDSEAVRELPAWKLKTDRALLRMAESLHGNLTEMQEKAPEMFAMLAGKGAPPTRGEGNDGK